LTIFSHLRSIVAVTETGGATFPSVPVVRQPS